MMIIMIPTMILIIIIITTSMKLTVFKMLQTIIMVITGTVKSQKKRMIKFMALNGNRLFI